MVNKMQGEGLPWWFSDKESTCQCRRHRLNWSGETPHAVASWLNFSFAGLNPCTPTTEPVQQIPGAATTETGAPERANAPKREKSLQWEAQTLPLESSPCPPQWEKSPHSKKDAAQPKINKFFKKQRERLWLWKLKMVSNTPLYHSTPSHRKQGGKETKVINLHHIQCKDSWLKKIYMCVYIYPFSPFPLPDPQIKSFGRARAKSSL